MPKPKAYDSTSESKNKRKGKEKKRKEILSPTEVLWEPLTLPLIYK